MTNNIKRKWVSLNVDLILDVPNDIDETSQEGQDYLREQFIDYLQSAKFIQLSFEIGEEDDQPYED